MSLVQEALNQGISFAEGAAEAYNMRGSLMYDSSHMYNFLNHQLLLILLHNLIVSYLVISKVPQQTCAKPLKLYLLIRRAG